MHNNPIVIAVDGWSSCGKSTMAKQLSKELHYLFVDSGAMYRAITLYFLQHQLPVDNPEIVLEALRNIHLAFHLNPETMLNEIYLNGKNVESEIRALSIAEKVSDVAAISAIRSFAVQQQQEMGLKKGIVMDGRDIGTTVFPHAQLKVFMTAHPMIRAQRRFKEMLEKGEESSLEEVMANLNMRDYEDTHRSESPLSKADDAIVLDNSFLTPDEQLAFVKQKLVDLKLLTS